MIEERFAFRKPLEKIIRKISEGRYIIGR